MIILSMLLDQILLIIVNLIQDTLLTLLKFLVATLKNHLMIGDSETDANAAKAASLPVILLENGYTEKNTNEIYHNHLIKDFIGIEKIVSKYF